MRDSELPGSQTEVSVAWTRLIARAIIDAKCNMTPELTSPDYPGCMARIDEEGQSIRRRIAAWMRLYVQTYARGSQRQAARQLGVSQSAISTALSGKKNIGLDVFVKLHKELHEKADLILWSDPPLGGGGSQPIPPVPSHLSAEPRGHRTGGGHR